MRRAGIVIGFAAAILSGAPLRAQQSVTLRFAPPFAQLKHHRLVLQTWVQTHGLGPIDSARPTATVTMYMTKTVIARNGGSATLATLVDSSTLASSVPSADSVIPGDPLGGMITLEVVDSLGRVDSSALVRPPALAPSMAHGLPLRGGVGHLYVSMPVKPVRVGESWTDSNSTSPLGGDMNSTNGGPTTYQFEGLERQGGDRVAVISLRQPLAVPGANGSPAGHGMLTGVVRFDLDANLLILATTDATVEVPGTRFSRAHVVMQLLR
jgi:hypothetical protein